MGHELAVEPHDGAGGKRGDDGALAHALQVAQPRKRDDHRNDNHGAVEDDLAFGKGLPHGSGNGQHDSFARQGNEACFHLQKHAHGKKEAPQDVPTQPLGIQVHGQRFAEGEQLVDDHREHEREGDLQQLHGVELAAQQDDLNGQKAHVHEERDGAKGQRRDVRKRCRDARDGRVAKPSGSHERNGHRHGKEAAEQHHQAQDHVGDGSVEEGEPAIGRAHDSSFRDALRLVIPEIVLLHAVWLRHLPAHLAPRV